MGWPSNDISIPFPMRVQLGLVPNVSRMAGFGRVTAVNSSNVPQDVHMAGGLYPWQTSAQQLLVKSTVAGDAPGGAGVQTVLISGLNSNRGLLSETVTLNGTTDVQTVNSFLRVNSMRVLLPGVANTDVSNAGDITARTAGGAVLSFMPAGDGVSQNIQISPPANSLLLIWSLDVQSNAASGSTDRHIDFALYFRDAANGRAHFRPRRVTASNNAGKAELQAQTLIGVPGGFDFQVRVVAIDSASNTDVTAAFEGLLFQNLNLNPF